ncbi:methyl-accepting chemotaxis protein [Tritonibacter scottomollicae]|uniref:Methyl-accepting chemotaxis protein n=2 Tax=Pseudomonadota TaxID=1224 RepID=A0A2T0ZXM9_TRISK|nr:HAMP domain-containing methyl-accepting chemotaxis protein [Tritonibacter scottomollicae]PRZ40828.1 methyl-accepting chemotaxis protein [Tritonibacter scottomollicae]
MFLKSWFRNMPVKRKILLPGMAGLLMMIGVITTFWAQRLSTALHTAFEEQVELTETYIAAPLATAAWNYNGELANTTLASLSDRETFVFARVVSSGDVLAEAFKGDEMLEEWAAKADTLLEAEEFRMEDGDFTYFRTPLLFEGEEAGNMVWALDTSIINEQILHANTVAAGLGFGIFAAFSVIFYMIAVAVSRPISDVITHIDALQHGDTSREIPEANRRDEIGALGKALVDFRDTTAEQQRMEEEKRKQDAAQKHVVTVLGGALDNLSTGDLTVKIDEDFPDDYEKLRQDFNALVSRLFDTVSAVVDAADSIQNGSTEISSASDDLARRTESQAATLEETAAALDELTASVRQAAEGAGSVSNTMEEAKAEAVNSGTVVNSAVSAMTEIEQSSSHISQIIGVIDDIAFQTNLLALNAGVEAARAGEAGRGFAVVASEVRALAQRSSGAAMEIKTLIGDSSKQVERGVDLVGKAGEALHNIVERVTQISGLISDIAQGASEQSAGLGDINGGMVELDQVTQQNAAMVEEATAASHMLKANATNLAEMVAHFKLGSGTRNVQSIAPAAEEQSVSAPSAHGDDWDYTPEPTKAVVVADNGNAAAKIWDDF